jgi:hypothetical protein
MAEFVNMPIPVEKFQAVCALLAGTAPAAIASTPSAIVSKLVRQSEAEKVEEITQEVIAETVQGIAVDSKGIPFDPSIHTGTKNKDGTWRVKKGMADKAAELEPIKTLSETSTPSPAIPVADGATEQDGSTQTEEPVSAAALPDDEEDEFAAFTAAAAKVDAIEEAAVASIPERVWTDADLGALCNQAAIKLNDPVPVKALIAEFVPAGEVAHSRNVPADKRAAFVAAVEAKTGIEFAG